MQTVGCPIVHGVDHAHVCVPVHVHGHDHGGDHVDDHVLAWTRTSAEEAPEMTRVEGVVVRAIGL